MMDIIVLLPWNKNRFCLPCVMYINWNYHLICLLLLVLLSGYVHLNPGPAYPCGQCSLNVNSDDKALCCDGCNQWVHVSCDHFISESVYDNFVGSPTSDPWFCSNCIAPSLDLTVLNTIHFIFTVFASMLAVCFHNILLY